MIACMGEAVGLGGELNGGEGPSRRPPGPAGGGFRPLAAPPRAVHYAAMHAPRTFALAALALAVTLPVPLLAQRQYRLELSGAGAYNGYDSKTDLAGAFGIAGRLGYWIAGPLGVEVEGTYANPKTDTPLQKRVKVSTFGGWLLGNFPLGTGASFFLKAGYGSQSYGKCPAVSIPGSGPCGAAGVLQGGAGLRVALTPTLFMRYEGAFNRSTTTLKFSNYSLQGGLSLMLGSRPIVDSDGDGVNDRDDSCAATRLGALVDKKGCPTDQDSDGVPDGIDRCPNSVPGATPDEVGCTRDSDGDGYLDGLDECPDTPQGALVNGRGCPSDGDGDGVFDGLDRCQDTPAGATVDGLGCPGDADNDRVFDGLDRCPETPIGAPVDVSGCPTEPLPDTTATPTGRTWVLPGAVWQFRGSALAESALPALDSIAALLQADPTLTAEINGFAHDRLVPNDNTRLSQRRAEVVRNYLIGKGIPVSRVTAIGRGSDPLLINDTTDEARTTNRRVEIRVSRTP